MTVGTMEAAYIKGNNRPGDVRRLVPNGVMVSVQIFIGYIETNPLWHVLNSFFISGRTWAISISLARGWHHTASELTLFHGPHVSPTDITFLSLTYNNSPDPLPEFHTKTSPKPGHSGLTFSGKAT
jgi:hypothetical protein